MSEPTAALAEHPFVRGLSERHLALLAGGALLATTTPGQLLGREGQEALAFYLVRSGHVALEIATPSSGTVRVQTVGPGEALGWSWLVPPHRWRFDCRALDTVETLGFDGAWLRGQCAADHELGYQLLRRLVDVIAARLTATRLQVLDVYK